MTHRYDCPVCLKPVSDSRVLPCQHTFCRDCLTRIVQQGLITCPTCRKLHVVSNADLLPKNFALEEVLKESDQTDFAELLRCHNCSNELDSNLVKFFGCLQCTTTASSEEPHISCANCVVTDHWGHADVMPIEQFYSAQQAMVLSRIGSIFDDKTKAKIAVTNELTALLSQMKYAVPLIVQTYNQIADETQQLRKCVEKAERLSNEPQQKGKLPSLSELFSLEREMISTVETVQTESPYVLGPLSQLSKTFSKLYEATLQLQEHYNQLD